MIEKMLALHRALTAAEIPHAFGGALALAWCVREPRTTADIDLNIFLPPSDVDRALAALPEQIERSPAQVRLLKRDGQARLLWDRTPVDLFFSVDDFHVATAGRCRQQVLAGELLPFLACSDLAVFKAFFARDKDWVDLAGMAEAGAIDRSELAATIAEYLGADDPRLGKIAALPAKPS